MIIFITRLSTILSFAFQKDKILRSGRPSSIPTIIVGSYQAMLALTWATPEIQTTFIFTHLSLVCLMSLSWGGSGLSLLNRDGDVGVGVEADVIWTWASLCRCRWWDCWTDPRSSSYWLLLGHPSWARSRQVGAKAERFGIIWIHEVFWSFVIGILIVLPLIRLPRVLDVRRWEATTIDPNATIAAKASAESDLPVLRIIIGLREQLHEICCVKFLIFRRFVAERCRRSEEILGFCEAEARFERLGLSLDDGLHGHVHMIHVPLLVLQDLGLDLLLEGCFASCLDIFKESEISLEWAAIRSAWHADLVA